MKLTTHVHLVLKTSGSTFLCPLYQGCTTSRCQVLWQLHFVWWCLTLCLWILSMALALSEHSGTQNCEVASRILVNLYTSALRTFLLYTRTLPFLYMGQNSEIEQQKWEVLRTVLPSAKGLHCIASITVTELQHILLPKVGEISNVTVIHYLRYTFSHWHGD